MLSTLWMDIRKLFGANVRRYRVDLDISQEALGVRMGVDRAYVSAIERGVQNVTLLSIWEVAQALGVRPAALLAEDVVLEDDATDDEGVEP
jgi:transcriptional regulator with XRE-family HTH domain